MTLEQWGPNWHIFKNGWHGFEDFIRQKSNRKFALREWIKAGNGIIIEGKKPCNTNTV